ncbi:hypothetical protein N1851_013043 [Merluccius polli]|uniref:Uncharacterized protein n=1 Tax=Merluccius polli TaxID=89951 RepID=A0AA47MWK9_MERPO|nr:hypothetical protein N1851_013043 [Merluccius polli]
MMFKRDLRTNFDLLKPAAVKDTVQHQQEEQVLRRNQRAKQRAFSPGDKVLAKNYSTGPRWVFATIVAQTGPVAYTVQTTQGLTWKRHVDQLLQMAAAATSELPLMECTEESLGDYIGEYVSPPGSAAAPEVPVPDPPPEMVEPPSLAVIPSPSRDSKTDLSSERRYPVRERRPPRWMVL